jgi:hypothetical protein
LPEFLVRRFASIIVLSLLLAGCAGLPARQSAPPPRSPVLTTEKVVYVVPKHIGIIEKSITTGYSYRGISLTGPPQKSSFDKRGSGTSRNIHNVLFFYRDRNVLELIREEVLQIGTGKWRSYNKYYIDFAVEEKPDDFVLTFTPKEHEFLGDKSLTVTLPPPVFDETTLLDSLATGSVEVKFEVDSPDGKDAVYANFKRKLVGKDLPGSKNAQKDARTGTFTLKKGSVVADPVEIEVWAYKNGSKTVVKANVKLYPTTTEGGVRTVDVKKIVEDVKGEIESLVKS